MERGISAPRLSDLIAKELRSEIGALCLRGPRSLPVRLGVSLSLHGLE